MRFTKLNQNANGVVDVKGIPFDVCRRDGVVQKLEGHRIPFGGRFEMMFFLGMSAESCCGSEWWGQKTVYYDSSERAFIGDRIGRIRIVYENNTQVAPPVIFGVNAFNYEMFCGSHDREKLPQFGAPYEEPFKSDPNAAQLLHDSLVLMDNDDPEREKNTRWVFGIRLDPEQKVKFVELSGERLGGFHVGGISALNAGETLDSAWRVTDLRYFLSKEWLIPAEKLKRRLYTYKTQLPEHNPVEAIEDFRMPDIRFEGAPMAELFTNVYRKNIDDMQKNKVTEDGAPHTSSEHTASFGCYLGLGTWAEKDDYFTHMWARDVGRLLTELVNLGDFERPVKAAEKLFECLYLPFNHEVPPHWKRIANLLPEKDVVNRDLDANENDGHASIMLFMYTLWAKGAVGDEWVCAHEKQLRDAADFILWQIDHPAISGFDKVLFSYSEASSQDYGGFDLYSNVISAAALTAFGRMFAHVGETDYAESLEKAAQLIRRGVDEVFMCDTPENGRVYTDTTEDCWTYEYKRFCEALMFSDIHGYDLHKDAPDRFEVLSRTFEQQKAEYYSPFSGRQMGYGQGYLNNTAILLDRYEELTECVEASAAQCWNSYEWNYIVPEGIIMHGSGEFWFRQSDLGNGVQQAEIVKAARLLCGIDDMCPARGLSVVPRLPNGWSRISVRDYKISTEQGVKTFGYTFERIDKAKDGFICALGADEGYAIKTEGDVKLQFVRFGPFSSPDVRIIGAEAGETVEINGKYFVYVKP